MPTAVNSIAPHFWDLLESPRLSLSQVKARLRAGWRLAGLAPEQQYCSAGGVGLYSHYLIGPSGELAQLTNNCLASLALPEAILVEPLDMTVITLDVPFAEKDEAKAQGARWDSSSKKWQVRPAHAERCLKWISPAAEGPKVA